jgi:hypothetical protein
VSGDGTVKRSRRGQEDACQKRSAGQLDPERMKGMNSVSSSESAEKSEKMKSSR